ncbi:MAG: GTP-binding protein [Myxococcota bacterium]
MVAVTLVTGFLGAGKTTAVRHLLGLKRGERVAVVVNDFGEAEIDAAILGEAGQLASIAGSCVCCTAPEGFVAAVGGLLDQVDRIVVEPTGLAHPADLLDTLRRAPYADRLAIGPVLALVDPEALVRGSIPSDHLEQAGLADVIVANRTDVASPEAMEAFRAWVATLDPAPLEVVETHHGQVGPHVLAWPEGEGPRAPGPVHHHHHDPGTHAVRSWAWPPEAVLSRAALLEVLRPPLVRAKGLLRTDEGWVELQLAGGRLHEAPTAWRRDSRLDVFADDAAVLHAAAERIDAARLPPEALARRGEALEVGGKAVDRAWLLDLPDQVPDVAALVPGRAGAAVRLSAVLRAAGADPAGQELVVVARDGYTTPPVPAAELAQGLLLHSLDGGPLPASAGGPFRLLVPGRADACGNVKGVVRLALRAPRR